MKKTYQIFVIGAIILLGGVAFYLTYKKMADSLKKEKGIGSESAISVDLETDINKRVSYIIAQKKASLFRHYDENSELVWTEEGKEKSYRGTKEIQGFWENFFREAQIASSDSINFQMIGNKSQVEVSFVIWKKGVKTTLKKFYRLELGENGKIRREIFADQLDRLAPMEGQRKNDSGEIFKIGVIKEIDQSNGRISLDLSDEAEKISNESFTMAGDAKVLDGQKDLKEVEKSSLTPGTRVEIAIDQETGQIKSFIIENKL